MKYRITPFHLPALYFLVDGIYTLYKDSKIDYELGLGGLAPYILVGLALIILAVDLIIQVVAGRSIKHNPRKMIYLFEFAIIAFALLWVWRTFYPTIHR